MFSLENDDTDNFLATNLEFTEHYIEFIENDNSYNNPFNQIDYQNTPPNNQNTPPNNQNTPPNNQNTPNNLNILINSAYTMANEVLSEFNEGIEENKNLLDKKTKRENFDENKKKHDKYAKDNMSKKTKINYVKDFISFSNDEIKKDSKLYSYLDSQLLLEINTNELIKSNVQYNKVLLEKK